MTPELEKLIDYAIADGNLPDKKKEFLYKKAKELNVDMEEFEMVLEGKLHLAKKAMQQSYPVPQAQQSQTTQTNKQGDIKKCPSCGANAQAFSTKCPECGYEFRNIETANSVKVFFQMLDNIQKTYEKNHENPDTLSRLKGTLFNNAIGKVYGLSDNTVNNKKKELISNFPVPNTKEDILEFLALAMPQAKVDSFTAGFAKAFSGKRGGSGSIGGNMEKKEFAPIWYTKCEQIIIKARFSMKDDKKTLDEIEYYAKQLGIK